jgi:hypothetical protein
MCREGAEMFTVHLPAKSPADADICLLIDGEKCNMTQTNVSPQHVNKSTFHAIISKLWCVLEEHGDL